MEAKRAQVVALLHAGMSVTDVANEMSVSRPMVYRWKKCADESGDTEDTFKHKTGAVRPRLMTGRQEKQLLGRIKKDRSTSITEHGRRAGLTRATAFCAVKRLGGVPIWFRPGTDL